VSTDFTAKIVLESARTPPSVPGFRVREGSTLDGSLAASWAQAAWYWPEAASALPEGSATWEIGAVAEVGSPIERALALTEALCALIRHGGVRAVVWEQSGLVHEPASWLAQSEDASETDLPLFLWLGFEGTQKSDGTHDLRTRGAPAFGALEVEVVGSKRDGEELLETVCDVALFVLTSPAPLEDGDQVEVTRGKVRVRIEPSSLNDGSKAYRLRLP
jgi:Domain of unknown function (DUF4261)